MTPFVKQLYPLDKDSKEMDIRVANPFALQTQRLHRRGVSVCACAGSVHSLRAVLSLFEKKLGSCALRRAAAWTAVSPRPAQDHHEHEDPVDGAGRRDDQDQDGLGELRHRHRREPRGGNEVCIE